MMPIGDDNSLRKTTPIVTYILIIMNILFFFVELAGGEEFIKQWAFIPQRFTANPQMKALHYSLLCLWHAGGRI